MNKIDSDGKVPIYARLTIDGLENELSSGIKINPEHWSQKFRMVETDFPKPKLNEARDFYVFCSFTGLAYAELRSLAPEHIIKGLDGEKWIDTDRQKTGVSEKLPLLPIPLALIEKYRNDLVSLRRGTIFPVPTNQDYNRSLQEIAAIKGLKIVGKSHEGRYFFANELTYNAGVQPRTIGKMMGQKSPKSIDTYLRPNRNAISRSMKGVKEKFFDAAGVLKGTTRVEQEGARVISIR